MQAQTIQHLSAVLKTAYLPAFRNQITTDPSPFMEKIRKIPLTSNTIVATAPIGLNGGFSFGTEETAPKAGAQKYASFKLEAKNMYVNIEITDKTVKLGSSSTAAMLNAFDQEVKGAYNAANFHVGRALFGDGSGILAVGGVGVGAEGNKPVSFEDTSMLREGMIVDIRNYGGDDFISEQKDFRIVAVDHSNKTVLFDRIIPSAGNKTKIVAQGSYDNEITGIKAVMDDTVTSVYGVEKATSPWVFESSVIS